MSQDPGGNIAPVVIDRFSPIKQSTMSSLGKIFKSVFFGSAERLPGVECLLIGRNIIVIANQQIYQTDDSLQARPLAEYDKL